MSSIAITSIVFTCVFGSALLGLLLRVKLPQNHLSQDSKDVVKLAMGLIATMAALVLGLLTASAKSSFDTQNDEVKQSAAKIILLDRALAHYGPETKEVRELIRHTIGLRLDLTWPEDSSKPGKLDAPEQVLASEGIYDRIRALSPQNDAQRELQAKALQISGDLLGTRWLLLTQSSSPIPMPFLVVLVFWLSILFASFGLFAPRNATVIAALVLSAVAVSGSTFLILEMSRPFEGMIKISSAPVRYALSQLGK
jgi:hypothetical protein